MSTANNILEKVKKFQKKVRFFKKKAQRIKGEVIHQVEQEEIKILKDTISSIDD